MQGWRLLRMGREFLPRMNTNQKIILKDEVFAIVGSAMEVHNQLGAGFAEAVYQEAMAFEFTHRGIPFVPQKRLRITYKGVTLACEYVADFVCFDAVIVEIKAIRETGAREEAQVINYLKATGLPVGVLINFGDPGRLDWSRFVF